MILRDEDQKSIASALESISKILLGAMTDTTIIHGVRIEKAESVADLPEATDKQVVDMATGHKPT
jgi:hypothetical protein